MEVLNTVLVQQVDIKDPKQYAKGQFWPVGLKAGGKWYNTTIFKDRTGADAIKALEGTEAALVFFTEKYQDKEGTWKEAKKFRLPTITDKLELRVRTLEQRMDKAAAFIVEQQTEIVKLKKQLDEAHASN